MREKKELVYAVYGEITKRYFGWKDVVKMLRDYAMRFNKRYVCELDAKELQEVLKDLKGVKNG